MHWFLKDRDYVMKELKALLKFLLFLKQRLLTDFLLGNCFGGEIIAYVQEDLPSKLLPLEISNVEGYCVEINLRKTK